MTDIRSSDNYIFNSTPSTTEPSFSNDLAMAFARLLIHGNGGTFRLTKRAVEEIGAVKITRTRDAETGDVIFRAEGDQ